MASTAALELIVSLNDKASKGLQGIAKQGGFLKQALSFAAGGAILQGVEKIGGAITDVFKDGLEQSKQWSTGMAQLGAVLKSTGGKAGVTEKQVVDLANSLSASGGLSQAADDSVLAGENMLLTFTNIGSNVFPKATQTMLDMATAMNGGLAPSGEQLSKTAIQLGKALNDPVKGITALQKVGVTFTAQQKEQIKTMMAMGDTAGAQAVILKELGTEFGGSALASAQTLEGQMVTLSESFNNVKQAVAEALMPALQGIMEFATAALAAFQSGDFSKVGQLIMDTFNNVVTWIGSMVGPVTDAIGGWVRAFVDWVIPLLPQWLAAIGDFIGGVVTWIGDQIPGIVSAIGGWITAFVQWVGPLIPGWLQAAGNFIGSVLGWIAAQIPVIASKIGEWASAFINWVGPMLPGWIKAAGEFIGGVLGWIVAKIPDIVNALVQWAGAFIGWVAPMIPPMLAELGKILLAVGDWIVNTAVPSILQQLGKWGKAFIDWIAPTVQAIPGELGKIASAIWDWISTTAKEAYTKALEVGKNIYNGIKDGFTAVVTGQGLQNSVDELAKQLKDKILGEGNATFGGGGASNKEQHSGMFQGIPDGAKNAMNAAAVAISLGGGDVVNSVDSVAKKALDKLNEVWAIHSPSLVFLNIGNMAMAGLSNGLKAGGAIALAAVITMSGSVRASAANNLAPGYFVAAGMNVGRGLANGIASSRTLAISAAIATANAVKNSINAALGIHSPSTEAAASGRQVNAGLVEGLAANGAVMTQAAKTSQGLMEVIGKHIVLNKDKPAKAIQTAVKGAIDDSKNTIVDSAKQLASDIASIIGDIGKVFDVLNSMGSSPGKMPGAEAINSFFNSLDQILPLLQFRLLRWFGAFDQQKADLASAMGDAVDGILGAVSGLEKLSDKAWVAPTEGAIASFFDSLDQFIIRMDFRLLRWFGSYDQTKANLAKAIGDSVDGLTQAVGGLLKLADKAWVAPTTEAIEGFFNSLDEFIIRMDFRLLRWFGSYDQTKADLAKAIGESVSGLLEAVAGLVKLGEKTWVAPAAGAIDEFFNALDAFLPELQFRILKWFGAFDTTKAALTKAMGDSVSGLMGALDPLVKLATITADKLPTKEIIGHFLGALDDFLDEFALRAEEWLSKAPAVLGQLATGIGQIAEGIGKVFDPLLKVADVQKVTGGQIEGALANVWFALDQFNKVMTGGSQGTPFQGDWATRAVDFATKIGTIFTELQKALGVISATGDSSGLGKLLSDLSAMWLTVFGPATQEGTFLYAIFGKPNGLFNWMDTNVPIYMGFSAGVWKTALLNLQEAIGAQLALMKTAVYNDALAVGQAIAQGIADGTAGIVGAGGGGGLVPVGAGGGGGGQTIGGHVINITVNGAGGNGKLIAGQVAQAVGNELAKDTRVRHRR